MQILQKGENTAPWRRAAGREGASCPRVIANHNSLVEGKGGKAEFAKACQSDDQLHESWLQKGTEHEEAREAGKHSKADVQVESYQTDAVGSRRMLGIFGLTKIWQCHNEGKRPQDGRLKLQTWQGQTGVILAKEKGCPLGCTELWQTSERGLKKSSLLADSGEGDDAAAVYQAAKKQNSVSSKESSAGDIRLSTPKRNKHDPNANHLDDILAEIWNGPLTKGSSHETLDENPSGSACSNLAASASSEVEVPARGKRRPSSSPVASPNEKMQKAAGGV